MQTPDSQKFCVGLHMGFLLLLVIVNPHAPRVLLSAHELFEIFDFVIQLVPLDFVLLRQRILFDLQFGVFFLKLSQPLLCFFQISLLGVAVLDLQIKFEG